MSDYRLLGEPIGVVDAILIEPEEDRARVLARDPDGETKTIETNPGTALAIPEDANGPWNGCPVYYEEGRGDE